VSEERNDGDAGRGKKQASLGVLCYAQTISWSTYQNGNPCHTVHEISTALLLMVSDSDRECINSEKSKSHIFGTSSA
jgi:hypothetical protein